jgi:hypothetical protein
VAIIGRAQVTTDVPEHHFMKHCKGRDIDSTTRGLGGTLAIPVTSCGEENLTMVEDRCSSVRARACVHACVHVYAEGGGAPADRAADALWAGLLRLAALHVPGAERW